MMTLILQSSTAVTMMLVGFASTGIITLGQAMGVILGADIGTSIVALLFSIRNLADYALILVGIGVFVDILSSQKKTRHIAMVILGFGFTFLGMTPLSQRRRRSAIPTPAPASSCSMPLGISISWR